MFVQWRQTQLLQVFRMLAKHRVPLKTRVAMFVLPVNPGEQIMVLPQTTDITRRRWSFTLRPIFGLVTADIIGDVMPQFSHTIGIPQQTELLGPLRVLGPRRFPINALAFRSCFLEFFIDLSNALVMRF